MSLGKCRRLIGIENVEMEQKVEKIALDVMYSLV